jgi:hypothetical protein
MKRYGVDNVRGGPYSKVNLTRDEINGIERRIRHNADACLRCGSTNHFANQCSGDPTEDESEEEEEEEDDSVVVVCSRCGRSSHSTNQCYATTYVDKRYLYNKKYRSSSHDSDGVEQGGSSSDDPQQDSSSSDEDDSDGDEDSDC